MRTPATNTGFASVSVTCKIGALCPERRDSVQVDSFCAPKPARTQSPKTVTNKRIERHDNKETTEINKK